jgi:hypothetical protein
MSLVEQLRSRVQEVLSRVRARRPLLGGESAQGQVIGGLIGGGKVIENVSRSIDNLVKMAKERRPNIIPTVLERVRTFEPGKRIKEFIPAPPPSPAPTPPPPGGAALPPSKILRE